MPLKPDRLERSLKLAENSRELWQKELASQGVEEKDFRKNPRWRALNASCRKIQTRIEAARDLETRGQVVESEESSDE
ncbi:hypothetical protein [Rubinisphaera margarita]|uniref:hypothetical protein n=1 Tax=Rubinisphaera margarita TaxID=2909586 RepID=UPI001EE882C7|nr:hypothetical protein [Rubinisphaera margarita]MCG6156752.1 hypothetical protein [Rubinisphaera margarita]